MSLPAQPNQSLIGGIACLQAVAAAGGPVGSRELARVLGLEPTRVNRLLGTLAHLGLVERDARRKYRPGPALHLLSAQSLHGSGLLAAAIAPMQDLRDLDATLAFGLLWGHQVCYLVHAGPGQAPEAAIGAHPAYPAARSVIGLALLAAEDDAAVRARLRGHATRDEVRDLLVRVAQARRSGWAAMPSPDGRQALAVGVGTPPIAALAAVGGRCDREPDVVVARLRQASTRIAAAAGLGLPSET